MKQELSGFVNNLNEPGGAQQAASYAQELLLFAAEEIKVTENGLDIVIPRSQPDLSVERKIPEMRNF